MVDKIKVVLIVVGLLFLLGLIFLGGSQQATFMLEHPGYIPPSYFMRVLE